MNQSIRRKNAFLKMAAILLIIGGIVVPVSSVVATTAEPRDNDANSIMWGGCYTKTECFNKIAKGDGHNSAANIQQIYYKEGRGMTAANFQNTVDGVAYKDGRIVVNGVTVATGATSIGRHQMPGSVKSGSVWETSNQTAFVGNSIPAWVNMDGGKMNYFVIKSCGNWGHAHPVVKPSPSPSKSVTPTPSKTPSPSPSKTPTPTPTPMSFSCVELIPTQPDKVNEPSKFRFTITPDTENVTITGYRFTFSDNKQTVDTDADTPFTERTFTSGTLKVNGQVKTSAGISEITEACSATVTVTTASPSPSSEVSASPSPTSTGHVLGATLPSTGPEAALGGVAGLSAIGFASRAYLRSRKSLLDAMRQKNR